MENILVYILLAIGTYTSGGSEGIYSCRFNQDTGEWMMLDSVKASNPSYLAFSSNGSVVYAVNENGDATDAVEAFSFNPNTGAFAGRGGYKVEGIAPCYLDTDGKSLLSANYGGSMNVFPLSQDGSIQPLSQVFGGSAGGPDVKRQSSPHVHCAKITPDGCYVLATDFSADKILAFRKDGDRYVECGKTDVAPGTGPRHIVFSPSGKFAYVIGELSGEVTAFSYDCGNLKEIQRVASDTLNARGSGDIRISPDGRFLYASNRLKGDGIAIFAVDPDTGLLTKVGYQPTGVHPRNFMITPNGKFLLCACRDSNEIEIFEIDGITGLLKKRDNSISTSLPVFVGTVPRTEVPGNVMKEEPVDYVNTLVGSLSKMDLSTGNTYPATARPWGTHFWTPQTGKNLNGWAYVYTDDKIRGFKQTHQPSPWMNDYGEFSIMPVTSLVYDQDERASWFSHKAEIATPYSYEVYLADHDTYVELAPTQHSCAFRITYPEKDMSYVVVDGYPGGSSIRVEGNRIIGYTVKNVGGVADNFKNWFVIECDTPFEYSNVIDAAEGNAIAVVGFKTKEGQQVNLKVGSSFISEDQAAFNMTELGDGNLDRIKQEGRKVWNDILSRIIVEDDNLDNIRTFYSCLYRSVLFPRDFSEVTPEGKRVHYSPHDGEVHDGYFFTDTGFWDTFRSLFALVDLVYPDVAEKMQEGRVNDFLESGFLPEWASPGHRPCMIGNNSASVVAEAYLKGIRGYDIESLWKALIHDAHAVHEPELYSGRRGWDLYDKYGYVPCDAGITESAARTLEYAYDDWCIWQLGKALGKSKKEIAPYEKASQNYRNLYRKEFSMMSGRNADGSFPEEFNPYKWGGDFTEGNAIQYTWSVFHDPAGLAELMGGREMMARNLDSMFTMPPLFDDSYYHFTIHEIREMQIMNMGNYAHGNQPVQHAIYLYDWCGQPWKTQFHIRDVMDKLYSAAVDGYCGDEDNGQTSAWYVFSAMGFYPVCPSSCEYAVGTPLFKRININLPDGKQIVINAANNSRKNFYISDMKLNGVSTDKNYITHSDLVKGAFIDFKMSPVPDYTRGTSKASAPYSYSDKNK